MMELVESQQKSLTERSLPTRDCKDVSFLKSKVFKYYYWCQLFESFYANVGDTQVLYPYLCSLVFLPLEERDFWALRGPSSPPSQASEPGG